MNAVSKTCNNKKKIFCINHTYEVKKKTVAILTYYFILFHAGENLKKTSYVVHITYFLQSRQMYSVPILLKFNIDNKGDNDFCATI